MSVGLTVEDIEYGLPGYTEEMAIKRQKREDMHMSYVGQINFLHMMLNYYNKGAL